LTNWSNSSIDSNDDFLTRNDNICEDSGSLWTVQLHASAASFTPKSLFFWAKAGGLCVMTRHVTHKPQKKKYPGDGKLGKRNSQTLPVPVDQSIGRSGVLPSGTTGFGVVVIDDWGCDRST